ncbi:glycosyltransferase [Psychroflexus sp. ALD_RP9]|uniref:glycosyltransferase n=1 Tax=Psychroflexus sp. ALD_RP9 TaxID=2777186 RepID=UPI001A8F0E65|nr:glycosyltransferase [Psychroflexus sp. ALD_RP9]QSS98029.1 glycosyltransferase [Psychroflexus sp. ALD_RP9]
MPKKILIISKYFYPTNSPRSFRTTELAKELARQGHDVKVITPTFFEQSNEFYSKINYQKIKYKRRLKKSNSFFRKLLNRILEQFFYYPNITDVKIIRDALRKETENFDLLISIAAPHSVHWGVASIPKKAREKIAKKWIADCGDPFMFAENLQYKRPYYFSILEKKFCGCCDFITVPTKASIEGYYKEFRHKIKVIPQGFKFKIKKKNNEVETNMGYKKIAYAGSLNQNRRNPVPFIKYLVQHKKPFKLYIFSNNLSVVERWIKEYPNQIVVSNYLPRKELLEFLKTVDFVVNFKNQGHSQTPSKLIDYAIADKPILNFYYNKLPTKTIDEFFAGNYKNKLTITDLEKYKIENVTNQFLKLC